MSVSKLSLTFAAFVMFLLFIACAATKFSLIWKDETYRGHPEKILVINAFPNPVNRRLFEDELVKALKDRRIDAVVSYTVMPNPIVSDRSAIAAQAKEVSADTILINKPLRVFDDVTIGAGGVAYQDVYVNTQTDVYDMKSDGLILSISAETWVQQGAPYSGSIRSYVKDLVNQLSRLGLFQVVL